MDRRSFLQGMLTSAAATTAVVKLASPEETAMLTTGKPVAIGMVEENQHMPSMAESPEVFMRHHGVFLCVGILTKMQMSVGVVDMVSWEGKVEMVPGLKRGEMLFEGRKSWQS